MSGRAATAGPPARLLLADGDPSLRRVLRRALQARGYQVALADTADTALEMAGQDPPDLVVLDLGLPGVIDAIRALRHAGTTPILLLTWPTEPDPQAALEVGADDYLTKPFGVNELLERVRAALQRVSPATSRPTRASASASKPGQPPSHPWQPANSRRATRPFVRPRGGSRFGAEHGEQTDPADRR
jgi:DNA-binding response OmpR family regulator